MTKRFLVGIIIVLIIIGGIGMIIFFSNNDINAVTHDKDKCVFLVKDSDGNTIQTEYVMDELKKYAFKKYKGTLGNTAHRSFLFYDDADNLLFTLVDVGNSDICQIVIDGKTNTYKAKLK